MKSRHDWSFIDDTLLWYWKREGWALPLESARAWNERDQGLRERLAVEARKRSPAWPESPVFLYYLRSAALAAGRENEK